MTSVQRPPDPALVPPGVSVVVTVSRRAVAGLARATARSLAEVSAGPTDGASVCLVVDLDGDYRPVGDERVVSIAELASGPDLVREARRAAATLDPHDLAFWAGVLGAQVALAAGASDAWVVAPGVHLLSAPRKPVAGRTAVVPAADPQRMPRPPVDPIEMRRDPHNGLVLVAAPARDVLFDRALCILSSVDEAGSLRALAADWAMAPHALEQFVVDHDAHVLHDPSVLLGPRRAVPEVSSTPAGGVSVEGSPALALDLTTLDPRRPWILDPHARSRPRLLLSEHPVLAAAVAQAASVRLEDLRELGTDSGIDSGRPDPAGVLWADPSLRSECRRADRAGAELPDVLGLEAGPDPRTWALALVPPAHPHPVARYLDAVRTARPDLVGVFGQVPGRDSRRLARWAADSGQHETVYDADLMREASEVTMAAQRPNDAARTPRAEGVNVVGYLTAESGLGESARQVEAALRRVGVQTSTFNVGHDIGSRRGASYRESEAVLRSTTLFCVNGAETASVAPQLAHVVERTRRIGMWYWELEDFPPGHLGGLQHVDEVWAATDFIRDAIAKHSGDVPVVTVTPPLPQAGDDPGVVPERFGIPVDRPWFLFTFDFLSFAARKNPHGLVEAFTRAFADLPVEDRPMLVLKTINADRQPDHAEQLRLQVAGRSDVMLLEAYLDDHERHVLVSHCTAYVSLHKAEGLGLTIAEAMAWGRPVITTAYGGVTQFCTPENSFLVDYRRSTIPETIGPYSKGLPWAEPDLDHAAALMRGVIDEPERAAAVGQRAARDIRDLHNAEVAGRRMREVLDQGDARWRAQRAAARAARKAQRAAEAAEVAASESPGGSDAHERSLAAAPDDGAVTIRGRVGRAVRAIAKRPSA